MTTKKSNYEAIPDVEKGETTSSSAVNQNTTIDPRELYPIASAEEAKLLQILDECIDGPRPELTFPQVMPNDVTTASPSFCRALVLPFLFAAGLCIGTIDIRDGVAEWYPYVAATILWMAASVSISIRLLAQATFAINAASIAASSIECDIDGRVKSAVASIATVQRQLRDVVKVIQVRIGKISKAQERSLKRNDANIEIPSDPADLEKELEGASSEIETAARIVKDVCYSSSDILPGYIQSSTNYWWSVVVQALWIGFVLQLGWTYVITAYCLKGIMIPRPAATEKYDSEYWLFQQIWWPYVIVVLSSFAFTVLEIAIVYATTTSATVAGMTNGATASVADFANRSTVGLHVTIEAMLHDKMTIIKTKLLKTIRSLKRIEEATNKPPKNSPSARPKSERKMPNREPSLLGKLFFGEK